VEQSRRARIRVCHVITRLDVGGAAENTLRSVCGLDPERFEVSLIYGRTDNPLEAWIRRAKDRGVRLIPIPEMVREIRPLADLKVFSRLYRLIGQLQPDLIHTHSSKAGILGRWAAKLKGVRAIVHTPHGHVFYGYYGALLSRLFRTAEKLTAKFTDRIVALTHLEVEQHLEERVGRRQQFAVIHSGVDVEKFAGARGDRDALRERFRVPPGAVCIGSAGRLAAVKNYELLLDTLGMLEARRPGGYHVVILGEGAQRGLLYHKAMELGVQDRFYLPGWFEAIEGLYPAFDLFVLCSKNEGMGRVLVEAMAAGVPVIGTAVGGVPELLGEGDCGLVIPPNDPQALAEAIERLAQSSELREALIQKGRQRARDYTADSMIEKLVGLYEELMDAKTIG